MRHQPLRILQKSLRLNFIGETPIFYLYKLSCPDYLVNLKGAREVSAAKWVKMKNVNPSDDLLNVLDIYYHS
jgi:hypothetical protein